MDKDIKLAKMQAQREETAQLMELIKDVVSNPVVELIGGMAAIEIMLNNPRGNPILKIDAAKQLLLETAMFGAVTVQQLSPSIPALSQGASNIAGSLTKLIPALSTI